MLSCLCLTSIEFSTAVAAAVPTAVFAAAPSRLGFVTAAGTAGEVGTTGAFLSPWGVAISTAFATPLVIASGVTLAGATGEEVGAPVT